MYTIQVLLIAAIAAVAMSKPQQQQYPYPGYPPQPGNNLHLNTGQSPAFPPPNLPAEGKSCLHTIECDPSNTVLSCERGKCVCPNRPQLAWTRGPHPLNTAWDASLRKCLSIKDSACDVFNPKVVYCAAGLQCKKGGDKDGFGVCSSSGQMHFISSWAMGIVLAASVMLRQNY